MCSKARRYLARSDASRSAAGAGRPGRLARLAVLPVLREGDRAEPAQTREWSGLEQRGPSLRVHLPPTSDIISDRSASWVFPANAARPPDVLEADASTAENTRVTGERTT